MKVLLTYLGPSDIYNVWAEDPAEELNFYRGVPLETTSDVKERIVTDDKFLEELRANGQDELADEWIAEHETVMHRWKVEEVQEAQESAPRPGRARTQPEEPATTLSDPTNTGKVQGQSPDQGSEV